MTMKLKRTVTVVAVLLAIGVASTTSPSAQGGGGRGAGAGQPRDAVLTQTVGTAMILGQVVTGDSGTPVRRARVNLSGAELRGQRSTMTDDEGRFVFTQLPAGRFTMTTSKAGFVSIAYGAKSAGRAGTPIQIVDGQKLEARPISMPRGGVVTGIVLDEYGEPSPGTPVRAFRTVIRTGEKRLESAGTDTTDDRGMYRIFGLQPGQFVVTAQPRNTGVGGLQVSVAAEIEAAMSQMQQLGGGRGQGAGGRGSQLGGQLGDLLQGMAGGRGQQVLEQLQQQLGAGDQPAVGYAPVFYPGTTSPSRASTVDVVVGQERFGVDFQLQLVSTSTVTGMLTGVNGAAPAGAQVTLSPMDTLPGLPGAAPTARAGQTGEFTFRNVAPGRYRIAARAQVRTPQIGQEVAVEVAAGRGGRAGGRGQGVPTEVLWAHSEISVDGQDVTGVSLQLQQGMTVSGRMAFDGTGTPPADLARIRVTLAAVGPQDAEFGGVPAAVVDTGGRFTFTGVPPGRYSFRSALAASPSGNWTLKSAVAGGRETLDFPLELGPNMAIGDAVLTFTDRSTELTGMLQDAQGLATSDFSIIIFPSDPRYWVPQARRIQAVRPGTDGRYTIRNLPPGDYALAAVTDVEPGEWFDPQFLQELVGASMRLSLADGDRKTQNIRLAGR